MLHFFFTSFVDESWNEGSDADVNVALDIPVLTGYSDCLTILKTDPVPSPIH